MRVTLNGQASHQHLLYEKEKLQKTVDSKTAYLQKAEESLLWRDEVAIQDAKYILEDCQRRRELLDHLIAMGSSCTVELDL